MNSWNSYPSIYNLGHRYVKDLLTVDVNVEEKIDGSQFSFGIDENDEVRIRSKGAQMIVDAPEKMFSKAVDTVKELKSILTIGYTYRAEYLAKPKHNCLVYNRVPNKNLILFDIATDTENYMSYEEKVKEATRIGLECVPLIYSGKVNDYNFFRSFLDRESILGGQKIEGVVVKPKDYNLFGIDKKVLMGKFVSEAFKEVHAGEWKKQNPTINDIIEQIAIDYSSPARWDKAILHLAEKGQLEFSPRDIGALMKEIPLDIEKEEKDEIMRRLYVFAWPHIKRRVLAGFPEYYKERLLKAQFKEEEIECCQN